MAADLTSRPLLGLSGPWLGSTRLKAGEPGTGGVGKGRVEALSTPTSQSLGREPRQQKAWFPHLPVPPPVCMQGLPEAQCPCSWNGDTDGAIREDRESPERAPSKSSLSFRPALPLLPGPHDTEEPGWAAAVCSRFFPSYNRRDPHNEH